MRIVLHGYDFGGLLNRLLPAYPHIGFQSKLPKHPNFYCFVFLFSYQKPKNIQIFRKKKKKNQNFFLKTTKNQKFYKYHKNMFFLLCFLCFCI
ncbi:hypothetical protein RND81_14G222600 [Saponaria officinalis]